MAVRIRKDGRVLCAAMHLAEGGDIYIDDPTHYYLSVEVKVLVTEPHEQHKNRGEWWWVNAIPADVEIDGFYEAFCCECGKIGGGHNAGCAMLARPKPTAPPSSAAAST